VSAALKQGFEHRPVLLADVVELAVANRPRRILDCTLGGAGHAVALLEALPRAALVGLDRDRSALAAANAALQRFGSRVATHHAAFSRVGEFAQGANLIMADLGVSSPQLERAERGFSFRADGPLDMRMDAQSGEPLAARLAATDLTELTAVIRDLGDERYASRVARAILRDRPQSTGALAQGVRAAIPTREGRIDAATRTFQALRMWVNEEVGELEALLAAAPRCLAPGGVLLIIAFHSGEDGRVKRRFAALCRGCTCPAQLPVCVCGKAPAFRLLTRRARKAGVGEREENPRARSARLRAIVRLP
jgi:16S rRNA (cytosine1402-N4)-methyltransferase